MHTLLISDLHLSDSRPDVIQAFYAFLENKAKQADVLYILGDLFELWVGDDDPSPMVREVIHRLRKLSAHTKLYVQNGNRDFLIGKRFARETGATLLPDHHRVTLGGKKTVLLHGDTLCIDDKDYQQYRRRTRNPVSRFILRNLSLRRRQKIADGLRSRSLAANANKADNILDVNVDEVERVMAAYKVKQMIHGHTHRPNCHKHKQGKRHVLGDWDQQGWYISVKDDHAPELISFSIECPNLEANEPTDIVD